MDFFGYMISLEDKKIGNYSGLERKLSVYKKLREVFLQI